MVKSRAFVACGVVLALLALSGPAAAHTVSETLGNSFNLADIWSLQCGLGTTKVQARVTDLNLGNDDFLAVTIVNPVGRSVTQGAPDSGTGRSALATMNTGPGNYLVGISHTENVAASYSALVHCVGANNADVPHNVLLIQDQ
jgi:hypothetical protein